MHHLRLQLDLQLFAQEKTEQATPRKKQEARQKGQVAKSMELPAAFILFSAFLSFYLFGNDFKERIYKLFSATFHDYMLMDISKQNVTALFAQLLYQGFLLMAPFMLIAVTVAVLMNFIQFGFLVTGEPLKMKWSKLNPIEGAKNILSLRSLVEFLKSLLKLSIIGFIAYLTLWNEREQILVMASMPLRSILSHTVGITMSLGLKIGIALIILAVLDYGYQRYEYEKKLRMSKQDIKDEFKKTEGDPLIKGKIREKQKRMALQRMMQEVPKADVVITNPTHFAIALQYDANHMEAPRVIAKGQGFVALRIKDIARQNGVVTMENKPLARALYERVDIGQTIPAELFQAVAEVLAYVYRLKGKVGRR